MSSDDGWGGTGRGVPEEGADRSKQSDQYGRYGQYGQYGQQLGQVAPADGTDQESAGPHGQQPPPGAPAPWQGQNQQWSQNQQWDQGGQQWGQGQQWDQGQQWQSAPAYGQYGSGAQQPMPSGFGGVAQPGIVPLRPLNVGEILDGAFRAIRANPRVMFGLSLVVLGVMAVIEAVLMGLFLGQAIPLLESGATAEAFGMVGASSVVGLLIAAVGVFIASIMLTAILIISVSQSVIGRVITVPEVWQHAKGQIWRLLGLTLLLGVGWVVAVIAVSVVAALLIAAAVSSAGESAPALVAVAVLLVVVGAMVAMAFFAVRLTLAAPAMMLERAGVMTSLKRSWSLTKGHFWRIFGALALSVIIVSVISYALMIPVSLATTLLGTDVTALVVSMVITTVLSVLISALTTPFLAAVLALAYIDVRMRKEGLDVELARAAEAR